jgi:hypothetical protein
MTQPEELVEQLRRRVAIVQGMTVQDEHHNIAGVVTEHPMESEFVRYASHAFQALAERERTLAAIENTLEEEKESDQPTSKQNIASDSDDSDQPRRQTSPSKKSDACQSTKKKEQFSESDDGDQPASPPKQRQSQQVDSEEEDEFLLPAKRSSRMSTFDDPRSPVAYCRKESQLMCRIRSVGQQNGVTSQSIVQHRRMTRISSERSTG